MEKKIILIFLILLFQCNNPALSNKEILKISNKCKSEGWKPIVYRNYFANTHIYKIQCSDKPYIKKQQLNINQVCIDGYKYIKNKNGTYTQMFYKADFRTTYGMPAGSRSLPIECEEE